jgi:uncharacterized protein YndB with AHSA1/START domain
MTTPDVPLRFEFTIEVPGPPEQVWDALATANGISSWMTPTDGEEGLGGTLVFHMGEGEGESSPAEITAWERPTRVAYIEPEWATLMGQDKDAAVTPLATEFLVEATSGGTCIVRVVTSAFGTGADWEQEFFDEMGKGWTPFFQHLRLYLTHFPGQTVTPFNVVAEKKGSAEVVLAAMRDALGLADGNIQVSAHGLEGEVEGEVDQLSDAHHILLRLGGSVPGYLALYAYDRGDGVTGANVSGYLFSDDAPAYVDRARAQWQAWLDALTVPAS